MNPLKKHPTTLFPNPVLNTLNLHFPVLFSGNIQISSLDGKILHCESIKANQLILYRCFKSEKRLLSLYNKQWRKIETLKFTKL